MGLRDGDFMSEGVLLRLPPRIKVLEALSAIADGRIEVIDEFKCRVTSSDGSRVYQVYVDLNRRVADSTDNGTRLRGYVGYPIIAFLMTKGVLKIDEELALRLKGIPWRMLNERFKSYNAVMEYIVKERNLNRMKVDRYIDITLDGLKRLGLRRVRVFE